MGGVKPINENIIGYRLMCSGFVQWRTETTPIERVDTISIGGLGRIRGVSKIA